MASEQHRLAAAALLRAQFAAAVQHVKAGLPSSSSSDNDTKLQFYALYKYASQGTCTQAEPSSFDFTAHAKW